MKTLYLSIFTLCFVMLFSCGEEKKEETKTTVATIKEMYQIDTESVSLKWTAYKTTAKKAVGGEFKKVNVKSNSPSKKIECAIDSVSFSVPISSLFTNNEDRDSKLMNLFFGVMDNTEFISGVFHTKEGNAESGTGVMDLTMNGKTCDLPYDYEIRNDSMFVSTTLNLANWNAQNAIESLNEACFELHKGEDGVSKTWSEVDINASVAIVKK